MHMENGLGRAGYLMLASVLLLLGAFGLAASYLAFAEASATFFRLGLGVGAVALLGLFGFAAWGPWLQGQTSGASRRRTVRPDATPGPADAQQSVAPETPPQRQIDFEFGDPEPAAKAAPEDMVLPDAFRDRPPTPGSESAAPVAFTERDPTAWPRRRGRQADKPGRNTWANQMQRSQQVDGMVERSPVREKLQERYTRDAPTVRGIMQEAPLHLAERAPPDVQPGFAAPGMSVGQCGRCKTVVMAPDARPIRLKCPECAKVTSLS